MSEPTIRRRSLMQMVDDALNEAFPGGIPGEAKLHDDVGRRLFVGSTDSALTQVMPYSVGLRPPRGV